MKILFILLMIVFLVACTSADVENMQAGLQKNGMTSQQASCYANELKSLIKAESYNTIAENLNADNSLKDAISKTRRKYGSDFKDNIKEGQSELDACLK